MTHLYNELRHQTYPCVSTWGQGVCGHIARGGGTCGDCIDAELLSLGIDMAVGKPDPHATYKRVGGKLKRVVKGMA